MTRFVIDLLPGSAATINNCLFTANVSNTRENHIAPYGYNGLHGSGALTAMKGSDVSVLRSTFSGNWNGVDDKGASSVYRETIFWANDAEGGISPRGRYVLEASGVGRRYFGETSGVSDLRDMINRSTNVFEARDPDFDTEFRPRSATGIGYRPVD